MQASIGATDRVWIRTSGLFLLPYLSCHVPRAHQWMQSPELQELTCSEPLTLEEEYENQQGWWTEEKKMLILCPHDQNRRPISTEEDAIIDSLTSACGDVSLVMLSDDDAEKGNPKLLRSAELDVMITDPLQRRQGHAQQGLAAIMKYAYEHLGVRRFVAKILDHNQASLALFRRLGFEEFNRVEVFHEVHMHYCAEEPSRLHSPGSDYVLAPLHRLAPPSD
ncbi:putative N-acetyltransferase 9 [Paratrimastix pyriformis]|uniref:N-acetyltransferase 9 n=1 Tax=Paratrimastix pyriformis TaxID=342808 RepID=A0ABQ8UXL1_9EUKA|nr:putative N-acetyltransferase 9 [Paratrimastix pyriformis]